MLLKGYDFMNNIELRTLRVSICVVIILLVILVNILVYRKLNTKRRKQLKKERRECEEYSDSD